MLASASAFMRSVRVFLEAVGLAPRAEFLYGAPLQFSGNTHLYDAGASQVAAGSEPPVRLFATIEIVSTDTPEPPDGGTPAALPLPVLAQNAVLATMYRASAPRPLAAQLAFTAARNVPRGRNPAVSVRKPALKSSSAPRRATVIKAKPVLQVIKKKAPKRRHVWLSNQSRVIRTVSSNVVQMHAPRTHRTVRSGVIKSSIRQFKLAA